MSKQYFQPSEGRTSFFNGPGDAAQFVRLIMELFIVTSRKVDGFVGQKKPEKLLGNLAKKHIPI